MKKTNQTKTNHNIIKRRFYIINFNLQFQINKKRELKLKSKSLKKYNQTIYKMALSIFLLEKANFRCFRIIQNNNF